MVSTNDHVTTPKCRKQGPSTPTIQDGRLGDARIGENATQPRAAVGEDGQRRVLGSPNGVEVAADQRPDVGTSFGDGPEDLAATGRRFDVADPHLQMPLAIRAAADERRVQGYHDHRCCFFWPQRSALTKSLANRQGMAAQGCMMLSCVDREHLLQQIGRRPVGHEGAEMRLQPVQLRCRSAMRRPSQASLDPAARGTAKPGKPHRDLAEQHRDRMVPVVLHTASAVTVRAFRSLNGVVPGLRGDDRLLNTRQQPLRFGQGQIQISYVAEVTGLVDLHDVRARPLAFTPNFHQPQHPGHASTLGQRTDAKIPNWPVHPQSCGSPPPAQI